ncbi:MAG: protease modulator HflC [Clostridia bacterium]|nr:protease modulator HflC [Clostridia bacterium]
MKAIKKILPPVIILIAIFLLANSVFIVNEYESAIVKRFGHIEAVFVKENAQNVRETTAKYYPSLASANVVEGTGIHFKVPFVDQVTKYSNRLLTYDTSPQQVITSDKKKLLFDNNAQWTIENPLLFDLSMRSISSAETRIDDIIYSSMREKIGKNPSSSIISDKELGEKLLSELTSEVNLALEGYGVEIYDIKIKRTDVPEENHQSIYNNMITERNRMAAQYRSEGEEEAIKTRSETDKTVSVILSEAKANAEKIKGEGDAEAARIYNEAYGADPEFYKFYNTLETYKNTLKDKVTLVLPSDSEFAQYLTGKGQ